MSQMDLDIAKILAWVQADVRRLRVTGLFGAARGYFLARLLEALDRPCLVVLSQAREAARLYRELAFFLPEACVTRGMEKRRLFDFPSYDISPLAGLSPHREVVTRRLESLYALTSEENPVVITSIDALSLSILPKAAMIGALDYLETGEETDRERLLRRLETGGYLRTSLVEERGDYAVRGGVIDLFPPLQARPVRLEFWGDRLESIRHFDPLQQRSSDHLDALVLLPINEILQEKEHIARARSKGRLPSQDETNAFPGQEAWLSHYYSGLNSVFDYLPDKALLALVDPYEVEKRGTGFAAKFQKEAEKYRQEAVDSGRPFPELEGILLSRDRLEENLRCFQRLEFSELALAGQDHATRAIHLGDIHAIEEDLELRVPGKGKVSMVPLAEKISAWLALGCRVVLVCRTKQQAARLKDILSNYKVEVEETVNRWADLSGGKGLSICLGRLSRGFGWLALGMVVVSEDEIFGPKRSHAGAGPGAAAGGGLSWTSFSLLKTGDLVVHQDHGIGRYRGLCKMEIAERVNDFAKIEYDNNDQLYVPADRISVLQKYVGAEEKDTKLDRLGGRSWDLVKKRAKKSIREIARQLVEIYAVRKYRKGFAYSRPDNAYREFETTFEHEETSDQIKAIDAVLSDMESEQPMDRLVCGDVGFGKTEVAIRAAFKAVMDGKQVAILVPTTVLAEQHYETFKKRMEPYKIRVGVLSRFKTRSEQKEIAAQVRSGKVDVLLGTHRILQPDISFRDLGLLVIDEEQRFGVKQKEKLKKYRSLVDVLSLTATPIPRTLHLSLAGIRDLSIIETPPEDRLAIKTYLSTYDEATIRHALESEIERGGQVFFVHNRVQSIERMVQRLKKLVPHVRFAVAHGQMKERDLEETMIRFLRREIDALVCTTIIESGLDIPTVNTIIINEVDRFGLSQIYQLRGRVGRSTESAYAYLLLSKDASLSREAEKRLKALMEFSHLGAGFHLAMHDLRIRGGGNILGYSQSGHISAIGYELYLKLVEQTIAELKGERWREDVNPEINVSIPAYLPSGYVSDTDVRLNLYRRLSGLKEPHQLEAMVEEMRDRFGPAPGEVENLLSVMSVRILLRKLRIERLDFSEGSLVFTFDPDTDVDPQNLVHFVKRYAGTSRFMGQRKLKIWIGNRPPLEALQEAKRVLKEFDVISDMNGGSERASRLPAPGELEADSTALG